MEKINILKLKGGYFNEETNLKLFTKYEKDKRQQQIFEKNCRVSLVYGINGSGKSSISRAIKEYAEKDKQNKTYTTNLFVDERANEIIFTDKQKDGIKVYNEDFIDQNIKLKEDKLGAIVIFGQQVKIDANIDKVLKELVPLESNLSKLDLEKYESPKLPDSLVSKTKAIVKALSNGYAVRDKAIKGNLRNTSIKDETIDEIEKLVVGTTSKTKFQNRYTDLLELITKIRNSSGKIKLSTRFTCNYNEEKIVLLLAKKINQDFKNNLEKEVLNTIETKGSEFISESEKEFSNDNKDICPYCLQPVLVNYKKKLLHAIKNVFNKDLENHIKDLEANKILTIGIELDDFKIVSSSLVSEIYAQINKCNQIIKRYNDFLTKKAENVFKPIKIKTLKLDNEILILKNKLSLLASKVNTYNQTISNLDNYIAEAKEVNLKLSKLETKSLFVSLKQTKNQMKKELLKQERLLKEKEKLTKKLDNLYLKKRNLDIAMSLINKYLVYIFSSTERLKLELSSDNKYRVISKGHSVKPNQLSIGERNALSLAYFFSLIQEESRLDSSFKKEYFIVLDDPISSFDYDNKVGIYSFLNSMFQNILDGNKKSRILILTHELEVLSNMKSLFNNIRIKNKNQSLRVYSITKKILPTKKIIYVNDREIFSNYKELLDETYLYAVAKKTDKYKDITIGNVMRKAVEAFTTFQYNTGITEVLQNKDVLANITDNNQKDYFKRRMFKLMFNEDSHTENAVKNYSNKSSLEFYGPDEKQKLAKEILAFIYLVNETHIKLYFKDNKEAINNIKKWSLSPFDK